MPIVKPVAELIKKLEEKLIPISDNNVPIVKIILEKTNVEKSLYQSSIVLKTELIIKENKAKHKINTTPVPRSILPQNDKLGTILLKEEIKRKNTKTKNGKKTIFLGIISFSLLNNLPIIQRVPRIRVIACIKRDFGKTAG